MSKLLHSNFARLKRYPIFWIEMILAIGYSIFVCMTLYQDMIRYEESVAMESILFNFLVLIGIVMAVFCSLFIGTEYSDGTIRNKLIIGHSRNDIFISNFILCMIVGVLIYLTTVITTCVVGIPLFGWIQIKWSSCLLLFVDGALLCIAYAAIYNVIAMLTTNKAHTAIISTLVAFGLLFVTIWLYQSLQQPEMMQQAVMEGGEIELETVRNPNYLTGLKREIYQFILDFIPSGQATQISSLEVVHPYWMGIYSIIIIFVFNLIGMICFQKKDLK